MRRPTTTKACSAWGNQPPDERRSRASYQTGPTAITDAPPAAKRDGGRVHNDQADEEAQVPRGGVAAVNRDMEPVLSGQEADQLTVCEAVVDEGLRTFVEVGTALATIREKRLHRQTHLDFASYLSDRFGIGKSQGYRMIDAAAVAMSPIGDKITNEAQARELAPLLDDPDRLRDVVAKAEGSGKITAASLRAARDDEPHPHRLAVKIVAVLADVHQWSVIDKVIADAMAPHLETLHFTSRDLIQGCELLRQALIAHPDDDLAERWQAVLDGEPAPTSRELVWVTERMEKDLTPQGIEVQIADLHWEFSSLLACCVPNEVVDRACELLTLMLNLAATWVDLVELAADTTSSEDPDVVRDWLEDRYGGMEGVAAALAEVGGAR
jgi:hypothetical protein